MQRKASIKNLTELTKVSTSLMQKQKEMTIVMPRMPFKEILHIMALGSWIDASFSSSLIWAPASGPMKHQMAEVRPIRVLKPFEFHSPPS